MKSKLIVLSLLLVTSIGCSKSQDKPKERAEILRLQIRNIATWGDSLTGGAGASSKSISYPSLLAGLTGYEVYNGGVGGQTSTQVKARMLADTNMKNYHTIIWVGRNNNMYPDVVKADIAEMVASLGHDRYAVVSVLNGEYPMEYKGKHNYSVMMKLNDDLKALYKDKFIDLRPYLVSQATDSEQDQKDKANDIIPASLRNDKIHLNDKGYNLTAKFIYDNFKIIQNKR